MSNDRNLNSPTEKRRPLLVTMMLIGFIMSLGCSVGKLVVQVATPTPTHIVTPQPTYTFTPVPTETFTPIPSETPTATPTLTPTPSPTPTETVEEVSETAAEPAAAPPLPPPPAEPTATPVPEEPTATPAPTFPFQVAYYTHDTGSSGETRLTGWIRQDSGPGLFKTLSGFQMKVVAPDGQSYLSELSGTGTADSTVGGTGDNHPMNTKLEIRPYTPGTYTISLMEGGTQVSPEVQVSFGAEPLQYVHIDFFKMKEQ